MPHSIQAKLAAARRRWRTVVAAGGGAAAFGIVVLVCLVSFHTDRLIALTSPGRLSWLIGILASITASAIVFLLLPLRRPLADESVAAEVERRYPVLNERLLTTIEMSRAGALAGASSAMVSQVALETERLSAPLDFVRAVPTDPVKRPAAFAGIAAVLFMGNVALFPNEMGVWVKRILYPSADIPLYARTLVWVGPGDTVVPRGEDVELAVKAQGTLPQKAVLHYRFEGGKWAEAELSKGRTIAPDAATAKAGEVIPEQRVFTFKVADAQQNLTYYATAGDGRANPHTIRVEDRPTILNVKLGLDFPAYMHRPHDVVSATAGNIVAPVGTHVSIEATANKPLKSVTVEKSGKGSGPWRVEGETARGEMSVVKDENYTLSLKDENGFAAASPPQYTIRAQPDQTPQVQIQKPATDVERAPFGVIDLKVTATDDYGISDLRLAYNVGKRTGGVPLPGANGGKIAAAGGPWSLATLHLKSGDTVTYQALASDTDNITGPHVGRSATFNVRIIGAAELKERLDAAKQQEREALKQLIEHQKAAQAQLAQAQKTDKPDASAQAQQAQRQVAQETADLSNKMRQTSEQLRDNGMAPPAEQKQRAAAEQQLQSLAQKAMPLAADQIQRKNLPEASKQEEAIRRQLEQMTEKAQGAPDAMQLSKQADQLAQQQQRLADQAALQKAQMGDKSPQEMTPQERAKLNALAKQQAALSQQTQALKDQIQQAAKDAQQQRQPSAGDLQDAARQIDRSGVQQKQQSAKQDLQQGQPQQASPKQNDAANDLKELSKSLEQAALNQQSAEAMKKRGEQLDKMADKLQDMANQQSQVASQARNNNSPQTNQQLMKQEQGLQNQAQQTAGQLSDMKQAQELVQRAAQNMQATNKNLEKTDRENANSTGREATRQLLQAAQDLRAASQSMQQAQDTKQAQREVARLARDQRDLQKQTQQLDAARQQPNQSQPQQQANQKQQQALAQNQAQLQQRAQTLRKDQPTDNFKWAMDQASQRMEGAKQNLQQQNTGSDTQRQQENAAQTLERIARALDQQAQGDQQQAEQQQSGQPGGGGEEEQAKAQGELQLAREMQAQIRQETASVQQRRSENPDGRPTAEQEREIDQLAQAQRKTQQITKSAAEKIKSMQDVNKMVQKAADEMDDVRDRLQRKQTDNDTQGRQQKIVNSLDSALDKIREQMRQQRQQMAQQQQQKKPGQQGQQQAQNQQPGGNNPAQKTYAPLSDIRPGAFHDVNRIGNGFQGLSPRAQEALREGRQEKVPAEYRDLVNQYYKALSERAK
jgi:hypothetical protein